MVQLPSRTAAQELMLDGSSAVADDSELSQEGPDWDILGGEWLSDEPELESDFTESNYGVVAIDAVALAQ
ncbi:MAG: hypothetical protein HC771_25430, partial [Synechococcales cyanobacterium CRU_2_2]|nr:hypothetical protein [Synechococcales cyanobacterium CRU_2_2]